MKTFNSVKYGTIRTKIIDNVFYILIGDIQYNDFSMLPSDLEENIISELVNYRQELGL
jgi:hypothetical protein